MFIALGFCIISTILSFRFKDIYKVENKKRKSGILSTFREYKEDLKVSIKFIFKSKRMKAYILFQIVIYSLITVIDTYQEDLLVNIRSS